MATSRSEPSPEVLAAIVAAVEMAWPSPASSRDEELRRGTGWRFSGRWWHPGNTAGGRAPRFPGR
ncbi:MAG: hypothetical protein ACT4PX_11495 [Actinomycetota bacterium]